MFLKAAVALALTVSATSAFAVPLTCFEIEAAAKGEAIFNDRIETDAKKISPELENVLRQALALQDDYYKDEAKNSPVADIIEAYDPIFSIYRIGGRSLTGVNLDFGDNAFIHLFDGTVYAGVRQMDGSLEAQGVYCDVDSDLL